MAENKKKEFCPDAGSKIMFAAATAFARKIDHNKNKLIKLTGNHRGTMATIDQGWIIIEQEWYAK